MVTVHTDAAVPDGYDREPVDGATTLVGRLGERAIGVAEVQQRGAAARLHTLWISPDERGHGYGRALLEAVVAWLGGHGALVINAPLRATDPPAAALVRGAPLLGEFMTKPVQAPPPELPAGFTYRPMAPDDYGPWVEERIVGYAHDNLDRMGGDLDAALERSRADFATGLPDGLDTPDTSIVQLYAGADHVGFLWLAHHRPGAQTFGYDLEIVGPRRGQGLGRAAMAAGEQLAARAGDTTLALHVFGRNDVARNLYRSWGFSVAEAQYDVARPASRT